MTVFSAAASKDLAIIVGSSLIAAVAVNLSPIISLIRLWLES